MPTLASGEDSYPLRVAKVKGGITTAAKCMANSKLNRHFNLGEIEAAGLGEAGMMVLVEDVSVRLIFYQKKEPSHRTLAMRGFRALGELCAIL